MMGKREAVKAILEGKGADRIPVIMNALSLPVARYGYTMPEVMTDPEKMTKCMVGMRRKLGYDGLCIGVIQWNYRYDGRTSSEQLRKDCRRWGRCGTLDGGYRKASSLRCK